MQICFGCGFFHPAKLTVLPGVSCQACHRLPSSLLLSGSDGGGRYPFSWDAQRAPAPFLPARRWFYTGTLGFTPYSSPRSSVPAAGTSFLSLGGDAYFVFSVPMLWAVAEVEPVCPVQPRALLVAAGTSDMCGDGLNVMLELNANSCPFLRRVSRRGSTRVREVPGTDTDATGAMPEPGGFVAALKNPGYC